MKRLAMYLAAFLILISMMVSGCGTKNKTEQEGQNLDVLQSETNEGAENEKKNESSDASFLQKNEGNPSKNENLEKNEIKPSDSKETKFLSLAEMNEKFSTLVWTVEVMGVEEFKTPEEIPDITKYGMLLSLNSEEIYSKYFDESAFTAYVPEEVMDSWSKKYYGISPFTYQNADNYDADKNVYLVTATGIGGGIEVDAVKGEEDLNGYTVSYQCYFPDDKENFYTSTYRFLKNDDGSVRFSSLSRDTSTVRG